MKKKNEKALHDENESYHMYTVIELVHAYLDRVENGKEPSKDGCIGTNSEKSKYPRQSKER